jgi:hypothetical protein
MAKTVIPEPTSSTYSASTIVLSLGDLADGSARSGVRELSELLQNGVQVRHPPVVCDLSVADSHGVNGFELDGLTGGCDAEKVTEVGAVVDLVGCDHVFVDGLPMDLGSEVGKRLTQTVVEDANAGFIGRGSGLGGVVDEVVGEQFIEQSEIALALDFFGVAADHCLGRFGFTVG